MSVLVEIPDEFVDALPVPRGEVAGEARKELALSFYSRGALSLGKAAELSGLHRFEFERLLAERRVERPYCEAEVDHDLAWGKGTTSS